MKVNERNILTGGDGFGMKITIEIPKEYEIDFKVDKLKDFFSRVIADMNCLCGNYEREIAQMLIEAFSNGKIIK